MYFVKKMIGLVLAVHRRPVCADCKVYRGKLVIDCPVAWGVCLGGPFEGESLALRQMFFGVLSFDV